MTLFLLVMWLQMSAQPCKHVPVKVEDARGHITVKQFTVCPSYYAELAQTKKRAAGETDGKPQDCDLRISGMTYTGIHWEGDLDALKKLGGKINCKEAKPFSESRPTKDVTIEGGKVHVRSVEVGRGMPVEPTVVPAVRHKRIVSTDYDAYQFEMFYADHIGGRDYTCISPIYYPSEGGGFNCSYWGSDEVFRMTLDELKKAFPFAFKPVYETTWSCKDKSRILEHDENSPAKYWCRKVQP